MRSSALTTAVTVLVVDPSGNPQSGQEVLSENTSGTFGVTAYSDATGHATLQLKKGSYRFDVPGQGSGFFFRSGASGSCAVPTCTSASVTITTPVTVTIVDEDSHPVVNAEVLAWDNSGNYLNVGYSGTDGTVELSVPVGSYRFAVPETGIFLTSGAVGSCAVPGCTTASVTITEVTVTINDENGSVASNNEVLAVDPSGNYINAVYTDSTGTATIAVPPGPYQFVTPRQGIMFPSGPPGSCTVPTCRSATITIPPPIEVSVVDSTGTLIPNVTIVAKDGSGNNVISESTDDGTYEATLLPGGYDFVTTIGGTTYSSGAPNSCTVPGCTSAVICASASGCATGSCVGKPNGTACNDGNACTQTDTCQSGTCTGSNPVTCTASDQCHTAGTCNTSTGVCSNPSKSDGTSCNDGNACTQTDTCQSGTCTGSNPVTCVASDQCHTAGTCNTTTGVCSNPAKSDGTTCSDGNACTQTDTCQSGTCTGSNPVTCVASDQCHTAGTCNTTTGVCSNPAKSDGTTCSDGNACTQTDSCQSGTCTGSNPLTCVASDQCHTAGTCNTSTGVCSNPAKTNGTACNDGNACTQTDTCQSGTCTGGNSITCTASDQCHTAGSCDPASGACSNPAKADGTGCSDGNACTQTDTCVAGTCTGGNSVTCTASDQCHGAGTCDPTSGACSNPAKADGTGCSDGNACTQTDTCVAGTCTGGNPVTCTASDQCHSAGTCNPANGTCSTPAKADGSSCSDGNACTQTDTCTAGVCSGSNPIVCVAADQCHVAGSCNSATGLCSNVPKADGTVCNDGNPNTQTDSCLAGVCVGTNPSACAGKNNYDPCDDGNACTNNDYCYEGVCNSGTPVDCNPGGDSCANSCDPATGNCTGNAAADGTPCYDGDVCTDPDLCQAGHCQGTFVPCVAADSCHTAGLCDPISGCFNPPKEDGAACDDGNGCTVGDVCSLGACESGAPIVCASPDQCHVGVCDPTDGACSTPAKANGSACDDGNSCTLGDVCQSGTCASGTPAVCVASDPCHDAGACDPTSGLCPDTAKAEGASCDDGVECTQGDTCHQGTCSGTIQANCGLVVPPIDRTVATDFSDATSFLYTGAGAIQTGVASGTIVRTKAAVVRGHVAGVDGSPLAGVTVTVHGHLEYGQTTTRGDGMFDIAVNGGTLLTFQYAANGFLTLQRQVQVPTADYAYAPDAVLTALDQEMTVVPLPTSGASTVVQGSRITDADGTRQVTLIVPEGTTATMIYPDGSSSPMSQISVRATEFTVGPNGPAAMPAPLPVHSGYTYCVEYSSDEAIAAGASQIIFNQPIIHYSENFLGFPVGSAVPAGYYDRDKATWVGEPNGQVVQVLETFDGLAELDTDGDNVADDAGKLAALGITDAERAQVAALYSPGQSLWRVSVPHFTSYDYNFGWEPPADATSPNQPDPINDDKDKDKDLCDKTGGSIIGCKRQTLGESVGIVGTPFTLTYNSSRHPGFVSSNRLTIPVSGPSVPASLKRIELTIQVAGRRTTQILPAVAGQEVSFEFDGKDVYGRPTQGRQNVHVDLSYVYPGIYYPGPVSPYSTFGFVPASENEAIMRAGLEIPVGEAHTGSVGVLDEAAEAGLGGWNLSVHQTYAPSSQTLYLGSGDEINASTMSKVISRVAGTGVLGSTGDGGPAKNAELSEPQDVAVAADGGILVCDGEAGVVREIKTDGTIATVLSAADFANVDPSIRGVNRMALGADGSLFVVPISVNGNSCVYRIVPGGQPQRIAGICSERGFSGDGGPATEAVFNLGNNELLAAGPDGSLYIADYYNDRVRRVGTDGIVTTVLGGGTGGTEDPDGTLATEASEAAHEMIGLAVSPAGELYFPGLGGIRKIKSDGTLQTVASLDGPATPAEGGFCGGGYGLTFAPSGDLFFVSLCSEVVPHNTDAGFIYQMTSDGVVHRVAGNGGADIVYPQQSDVLAGDQWPLHAYNIAVASDGVYFTGKDAGNSKCPTNGSCPNYNYALDYGYVYKIAAAMPGVSVSQFTVPSQDGSEIYYFSPEGRQLQTVDALTNVVRYQFSYSSSGLLTGITDVNGLVTTIARDATGAATAIVSPSGQQTTLTMGNDGLLATISNPANESTNFTYYSGDLLATEVNPVGATHTFTYDGDGRLVRDDRPAGGLWTLSRASSQTSTLVTMTSAEGLVQSKAIKDTGNGPAQNLTSVAPSGLIRTTAIDSVGSFTSTDVDGTVVTATLSPDPRFGMAAPVLSTSSVTMPSGLSRVTTVARTTTTNLSTGLLSSQMDVVTINSRSETIAYDNSSRTTTVTTPTGRQSVLRQDDHGRVVYTQQNGLSPRQYSYDTRGRMTEVTSGTGSDVRTLRWSYDNLDRPISMTDPLFGIWSRTFDAANRPVSMSAPDGTTVLYGYDLAGRLTQVTPPGSTAHVFGYTLADQEASYAPPVVTPSTASVSYTYDGDRRTTSITKADAKVITISYDSAGRLSTTSSPDGVVTREYSPTSGRLVKHTAADGGTIQYAYDGYLPLTTTWNGEISGVVGRTWNNDLRIATEAVNGGAVVSFGYDGDGLVNSAGMMNVVRDATTGLITSTALGAITDFRQYDEFGERTDYQVSNNGATLLADHSTYDNAGRVAALSTTVDGGTSNYVYSYDAAGRLLQVVNNGASVATYTYDPNGNRTAKISGVVTETGSYDAQDRQVSYGRLVFAYTANGERTSQTDVTTGAVTRYVYDSFGNLRTVNLPDGRTIDYIVDARNRRIGKKVNGVVVKGWLYRDGVAPVAEVDASGAVVVRFVYVTGGRVPSYLVKGGSTYRIITDARGTPRRIVDDLVGDVVQSMDVDEFGVTLADSAPGFQPLGFAGGLYDADTGLVHFASRDYDPSTGRWISKDPARLAFGSNMYAYADNDPINHIDPTGLAPGDRWYGYNDRTFQNWVHRQMKDDGQDDFTEDEIKDLWNEWQSLGKPGGDKWNKPKRGTRQCEDESMSDMEYPNSPDYSAEPSDDPDPDPEPDSGPQNSPFTPFEGPGPWWEDGSPVNPIPPNWTPALPGLMSPGLPGPIPIGAGGALLGPA